MRRRRLREGELPESGRAVDGGRVGEDHRSPGLYAGGGNGLVAGQQPGSGRRACFRHPSVDQLTGIFFLRPGSASGVGVDGERDSQRFYVQALALRGERHHRGGRP